MRTSGSVLAAAIAVRYLCGCQRANRRPGSSRSADAARAGAHEASAARSHAYPRGRGPASDSRYATRCRFGARRRGARRARGGAACCAPPTSCATSMRARPGARASSAPGLGAQRPRRGSCRDRAASAPRLAHRADPPEPRRCTVGEPMARPPRAVMTAPTASPAPPHRPWPVGQYDGAARAAAGFAGAGVRRGLRPRAGRARVWFELRDERARCRARCGGRTSTRSIGRSRDGQRVVAAGGCDYYPGSRAASPSFSFAVTDGRAAGEGDLLAQLERLRRALARRGPVRAAEAAGPRPRCRAASAWSRARAARRATTCLPACAGAGRAASCGRSRRCRTGTPRRRSPRAAGPRGLRGGRGDHRRPRRRLARGPVRVLRRDAVPTVACCACRSSPRSATTPTAR